MSSLLEHIDRAERAKLEAIFREELHCEIPDHTDGYYSKYHGGPGEFLAIMPCGYKAIVCRTLRDVLVRLGATQCELHFEHPMTADNFIEL